MISIIITSFKESRTIGRAIESFTNQKINDKYELFVLAPDEETLIEARKYSEKYKQIKVVRDEGKGKPSALNLVFRKTKGKVLILTDGDVYVSNNSVSLLLEHFKNQTVGAVTGRPISLNSRKNMLGFWSHLLSDTAHKLREKRVKEGKMIVCSGYLYAIRSGIVNSIPEEALSDDAVISHLIFDKDYKITYEPKAQVYVQYPTNFKDWIKQKKRSAGGYNQLNHMVEGKERMRSFGKESSGIFTVLSYPKTIKEFFYTFSLIFARIYLWILIFIDINIKKKELKKIWVRIESTK